MKRLLFLIVGFIGMGGVVCAQYNDTVESWSDNYYYGPQDETCPWFNDNSVATYSVRMWEGYNDMKVVISEHTNRRMAVKGIAALVTRVEDYMASHPGMHFSSPLPGKHAEYVYLCTGGTPELTFIDSARWDILVPQLRRFDLPADTEYFVPETTVYCHIYEAMFDEPKLVDKTFFLAGSYYSNYMSVVKPYIPTSYFLASERFSACHDGCHLDSSDFKYDLYSYMDPEVLRRRYADEIEDKDSLDAFIARNTWIPDGQHYDIGHMGPFFAIVDYYNLLAVSGNQQMGKVLGSGRFPDRSLDTIVAVPNPGFCFTQWSDGDTSNPRIVDLACDTLVTAIFDTCTMQDISAPDQLQFTVQPNPATHMVTIGVPQVDSYLMTLYDMAGRCLSSSSFVGVSTSLDLSNLPSGCYQLSLRSSRASGVKNIIKQ